MKASPDPSSAKAQSDMKKRKLEVKVTVLLSASKSEVIRIHKGDDVEQVAEAFIAEHGLDQHRGKLMAHIKGQVSKAKLKREKKVCSVARFGLTLLLEGGSTLLRSLGQVITTSVLLPYFPADCGEKAQA